MFVIAMKRSLSNVKIPKKISSECYSKIYQRFFYWNFLVSIDNQKKCLEDLSNELFVEIFDYLDGCDILDAFSNLNYRLEMLLHHPTFLYRINRFSTRERTFQRYCKRYFLPYRHQILSIHLFDQVLIRSFLTFCSLDRSFDHLQSLVLIAIQPEQLICLLNKSIDLPRLIRLNIRLIGTLGHLDRLYQLMFDVSTLKSLKVSIAMEDKQIKTPIETEISISGLEILNIDHDCSIDQFNRITSSTPQLRRLRCQKFHSWIDQVSNTLEHLQWVSIGHWNGNFEQLEIFFQQIRCAKLENLSLISGSNDLRYLDADRWEEIIHRYIPHLSRLNFQLSEWFAIDDTDRMMHKQMRQFTRPFWIEHQWKFQLKMTHRRMIYSIHSYR